MDEQAVSPINGYQVLLRELKARIRMARRQAELAVNEELLLLYWSTGRDILERQAREGLGDLGFAIVPGAFIHL